MNRPHPNARFDVFLSYNGADKGQVEALAVRLKKAGIVPFFDLWNLIPGEPWQIALERALEDSATCVVIIGPNGISPWQTEEMRAAIDRRVSEGRAQDSSFRVIPVLLPTAERQGRSRLPSFLTMTTWVQFQDNLHDERAFTHLCCGIRGLEPGSFIDPVFFRDRQPYCGLKAFQEGQSAFFFGREALTEWLLHTLKPGATTSENRFLAIVGASGSGKSSLARAGLLSSIRGGKLHGSEGWTVAVLRPGADPLESLAIGLASVGFCEKSASAVQQLIRELRTDERTLHLATRLTIHNDPNSRLVILIDQFEEVFTMAPHEWEKAEPDRFALFRNLVYASSVLHGQTIVILTLRADFYGRCAVHPDFSAAISEHNFLVGSLTQVDMRRAIECPVQLTGCHYENGLVDRIVADVGFNAPNLPLLQDALLEIWRRRDGNRLTHAAYDQIGGLKGALEKRANDVYQGLNEVERELCKKVFLRLIQPGEANGHTRRTVNIQQLLTLGDKACINSLILTLSEENARLLVMEGGCVPRKGDISVEIAHEALIHGWSRLRNWIEEDKVGWRNRAKLTAAVEEWQSNNKDASYLYRGTRLNSIHAWSEKSDFELNDQEREFLKTSILEEQARNLESTATVERLGSDKLQSLGRMTAGMIHEINNPLNYAKTGLYALRRKSGHLPETEREDFDEIVRDIEEGVDRVRSIISDLRTFTHTDDAENELVDVDKVIMSALRFTSDQLKDIKVKKTIPKHFGVVGNSNRFVQIFVNFLQNAIDALRGKQFNNAEPTIWITGYIEKEIAALSVLDNGVGIAPENIDKIFDPFFTTKDVGEGMGLGLSVCYRLVRSMKGTISVKSVHGEYCQIDLTFPFKHLSL